MTEPTAIPALKDPSLLKDACLVDGAWVQAASGETIAVTGGMTLT